MVNPSQVDDQNASSLLGIDISESLSDPERTDARLYGELDLANVAQLHTALDRLRVDGCRLVVLDLAGLRFLAAAGLQVIAQAQQDQAAVGGRLLLTHVSPLVDRILHITGLHTLVAAGMC